MALKIQLDNALLQLEKLNEFSSKKISGVENGALVETDKNWFYLGVSLSHLQVEDKELYGVSPNSPAYNSIRGKSTGDHFSIGKNDHEIVGVYWRWDDATPWPFNRGIVLSSILERTVASSPLSDRQPNRFCTWTMFF